MEYEAVIAKYSLGDIELRWQDCRIATLGIAHELLGLLFVEGLTYRVKSGLPEDVRCLKLVKDSIRGDLIMVLESETFDPVSAGTAPMIDPSKIIMERI